MSEQQNKSEVARLRAQIEAEVRRILKDFAKEVLDTKVTASSTSFRPHPTL